MLRLAVGCALIAGFSFVSPASAAEDTVQAAQKAAISHGPATAPLSADAGALSIDKNVADPSAAQEISTPPAAEDKADGVFALPKTGEAYPAVLAVSRNNRSIASSLVAWEKDLEYYIPVAGLAQILKFPSSFNASTLKIEGEFYGPENRYAIDAAKGIYAVKGETFPLPEDAVFTGENADGKDDLYVKVDLLNKIWPLDLDIDVHEQSLLINAKRKLPFELEIERQKRQERLEREKEEKDREKEIAKNYVYTPNGYRLLGPQTYFLSQRFRVADGHKGVNNLLVSGEGDMLGTSASYSLNVSNAKLEDFTIRLRREDYHSSRLLPHGLDLIDLGDISVRTPSLVAGSLQGTGLFVSTDRNRQNLDFDEVTIEGQAQPGWDVEVYSRGTLVDFGTVDDLGRYRFEAVPITFGNNPIRLVFYGPQGEIEERIENYSIAGAFLRPGETTYQAGVVKRDARVVDFRDDGSEGSTAGSFRINRGLNRYMSGYATFTNLDLRDRPEKYLTVGMNFNALGGYGQVEAYKQIDKGTALDVRYANTFLGLDTNIRSSVFRDFESSKTGTGDNRKKTETSLSFVKRLSSRFASFNLGFSADRTTYVESRAETQFTATQSAATALGNFSNSANVSMTAGRMTDSGGQAVFSTQLTDNVGFNAKLSYDYYPQKDFDSYDLGFSYSDNDRFTATVGYGQSLINTNSRSVNLGAAYDFDSFTGNVNFGWDANNGLDFTVGTTTTLGPRGKDNAYDFRRKIDGQPTRLSLRLYEDVNGDGAFNAGDRPVQGARVVLNGGKKSSPSDEEGYVEIASAGGEGLTTITLDRPSMTFNPFLISAEKDGHATILRAGTEPYIDFPLIMSGTVDGSVRDQNGRGMTGITVQLVDAWGRLAADSVTLNDGFYVFELVRPGRYVVQVHPSHRVFVPPKTVRVAADDLFLYGIDLQVLSNQDLGQASAAAVANDVEESGRVAHTYHPQAAVGTEKPVASTPAESGVQTHLSGISPSGGGVQAAAGISERGVQTAVRAVRFGEYPDKVRLVLDLSGPAVYRISEENGGSVIAIDLPDSKWEAGSELNSNTQKLFQNVEIKQLPAGGTRIILAGKGKIAVSHDLFLPAADGKGDRIFIDFAEVR